MYKLGDLIISGMEVYTLDAAQSERRAAPRAGHLGTPEDRSSSSLRSLLLHSLAAGAFPLLGYSRDR
jgi:hypothetical protein